MPSSTSTPSSTTMRLLTLLASASALVAAQSSVYIPGPVDDTPGAALVEVGAGADGYTTYVIEGVTLQENAQSAMMTQYDVNGVPTVYNCALGVDAQATCTVSQANGVAYGYVEPITYFGQSTAQLPAAFQSAATATASTTDNGVISSSTAPASTSSYPTALTRTAGPIAGQAQETMANVFGAAEQSGAGSRKNAGGMVMGMSVAVAALMGGAMLFA